MEELETGYLGCLTHSLAVLKRRGRHDAASHGDEGKDDLGEGLHFVLLVEVVWFGLLRWD
jgi:hypothetical protein